MATWRGKITHAARQFEIYELAGIAMFVLVTAIFVSQRFRLHKIIGVGTNASVLLNNLQVVFQIHLSWVFLSVFTFLLSVYIALKPSIQPKCRKIRELVRALISFCFMLAVYKITNFYIDVFNPFDRDLTLQHIDHVLFFGKSPSEWIVPFANPWLTDVFFVAYMSWFALIYLTLLLMWKHSSKAFYEYVTATIITFYLGYITYAIVPAVGPIFTIHDLNTLGHLTNLLTGNQLLLDRDCFPSLHTGISVIMLLFIRNYYRNLYKFYLVFTIMIILSTQYLRVHYGIDIIAGAALSIIIYQFTPVWARQWTYAKHQSVLPLNTVSSMPQTLESPELASNFASFPI